jgi:hypothetical protein
MMLLNAMIGNVAWPGASGFLFPRPRDLQAYPKIACAGIQMYPRMSNQLVSRVGVLSMAIEPLAFAHEM